MEWTNLISNRSHMVKRLEKNITYTYVAYKKHLKHKDFGEFKVKL